MPLISRPARTVALVVSLAVLALGCAGAASSGRRSNSPGAPDAPIGSPVAPPGGAPTTPTVPGAATRVHPEPKALDVRPRQFDDAQPAPGGRSIVVRWWGGVAPCEVLAGVTVRETSDAVELTLRIGSTQPTAAVSCIAIAQRYETGITLVAPLAGRTIVDGG